MLPVYFLRFPNQTTRVCFSKAQVQRVLRFRDWSREEAREACEIFCDAYPNRWVRITPKRTIADADPMNVFAVRTSVGEATFKAIRKFWKPVPDLAAMPRIKPTDDGNLYSRTQLDWR